MTNTTKKENIINTTTADGNNDAICFIKRSIKSFKESYQKFIAGGAYLFIHDANAKDGLREIVKKQYASKEEWAQVERQYRRRIAHAEKLATYYIFALQEMTVQEIFAFIKKEKITSAHLEDLGKTPEDANETNETEEPETDETTEPETDDHAGELYNGLPYEMKSIIDELDCLKATESEMLKEYYAKQGRVFIFRKMTAQEMKNNESAPEVANG